MRSCLDLSRRLIEWIFFRCHPRHGASVLIRELSKPSGTVFFFRELPHHRHRTFVMVVSFHYLFKLNAIEWKVGQCVSVN
jgi:hypothetical protein